MAALDVPKLSQRIKVFSDAYMKPKNEENNDVDDTFFSAVRNLIQQTVIKNLTSEQSYWDKGGIRMVDPDIFLKCMEELKGNTKVLGSGYYGKVFNVPANSCIENVPAKVKRVGVKVEFIKSSYDPNQSPERLQAVLAIAKRAAELGIGPALYDCFVTKDTKGSVQIIKIFEIIEGKAWENIEWADERQKMEAVEQLDALIHKMNKAGIIHHDLHQGNVMVAKSGRIYIIDYDLAKFVDDEENGSIRNFRNSFDEGPVSEDMLKFIYNNLLAEGSILLNGSSSSAKNQTRKNKKA